jgi:hypothetical protein
LDRGNLKEFEIGLDPFEFLFGSNRVWNRATQHCVARPLSLPHPAADTEPPTRPAPLVSRAAPLNPLTAVPCSCDNGFTRAQRSGAAASRPALPTTMPGPPLLLLPLPRRRAHPHPLFPLRPAPLSRVSKVPAAAPLPPFCTIRPSSSTLTLHACAASSQGPSRAWDAVPLHRLGAAIAATSASR